MRRGRGQEQRGATRVSAGYIAGDLEETVQEYILRGKVMRGERMNMTERGRRCMMIKTGRIPVVD